MSHMQLVMMIIVYGSVAFVSFIGVFGEQGECSPCSPKSLRGYCKKNRYKSVVNESLAVIG